MKYEFVFLPDTLYNYPSQTVDSINSYDNEALIISSCGEFFKQKCPNAIKKICNDNEEDIFNHICKNNYKLIVLDNCFYDSKHTDQFLKKIKLFQNMFQFDLTVISQVATYFMFKQDLVHATRIYVADYMEIKPFEDSSHVLVVYNKTSLIYYNISLDGKLTNQDIINEPTYNPDRKILFENYKFVEEKTHINKNIINNKNSYVGLYNN
jgi:hypothetical protein